MKKTTLVLSLLLAYSIFSRFDDSEAAEQTAGLQAAADLAQPAQALGISETKDSARILASFTLGREKELSAIHL